MITISWNAFDKGFYGFVFLNFIGRFVLNSKMLVVHVLLPLVVAEIN